MSRVHMKAKEAGTEWDKENVKKLLAAMKASIPESKRVIAYNQGIKTLDWQKVAFPPFSAEECEKKWREMFLKMRKLRSLTELIDEADGVISDPLKNRKIHPAFPKRPKPATAIYFSENYSKLQKQHPGKTNSCLMKIAITEFKGLPNKAKARYMDQFKKLFKEYTEKKLELRKKYGISSRKRKSTRAVPEKTPAVESNEDEDEDGLPPKPPVSGYILFCKEMSGEESVPKKLYIKEWSQRWRNLSVQERHKYTTRCKELKNQYATKLHNYLMRFDEDKQQQILQENKLKPPVTHKVYNKRKTKLLPGEPKKPSTSAHLGFFQEQMQLLNKKIPNGNDRFVAVSKMWKQLPGKEKEKYKIKMREKQKKYNVELKKWFKSLTADKQEEYLDSNPRKSTLLDEVHMEVNDKEEVHLKQPSDSEDEVTDHSSDYDDELIMDLNEVDAIEESEEDDVTFKMYL